MRILTWALCSILLLACGQAHGQVLGWADQFGGDWNDAANWTLGGPPTSSLDASFTIPASFDVEITSPAQCRNLLIQIGDPRFDGNGDNSIACMLDVIISSDSATQPNPTFDNGVSLTCGNFRLTSEFGLDTVCTLTGGSSLACGQIGLNADVALGPDTGPTCLNVNGSSVTAGSYFVRQGNLLVDAGSSAVANVELNIGVANESETMSEVEVVDSNFMVNGDTSVGFGRLRLTRSTFESESMEFGVALGTGSQLNCTSDNNEIICPEIIVGSQNAAEMLLGIGSEVLVDGDIRIGTSGTMRLLPSSTCVADTVRVDGLLQFDGGLVLPTLLDSIVRIENQGSVELIDGSQAGLSGNVINFGGDVSVESDCELNLLDNYLGENTFSGEGVVRFHGLIQPDDPDESAEELTGTIDFDGPNVVLLDSSTYVVTFDQMDHDRLNVSGNIAIQGGAIMVTDNLLDPFEFNEGDSFVIVNVNGNLVGEFSGQPEGSIVWSDGDFDLRISYAGGDGNDVTLTATETRVLLGDINLDGSVNLLDVAPFVELLSSGGFQAEGDIDQNGEVNLLDVAPFVSILSGS